MNIIINHSSMVPIYEQIVDAVKTQIRKGELKEDENLPSVRMLAKDLKISALTVKKAYDALEEEGFAITIHGKGTYITAANTELLLEEQKKEIEADLEKAVLKDLGFSGWNSVPYFDKYITVKSRQRLEKYDAIKFFKENKDMLEKAEKVIEQKNVWQ